MDGIDPLGQQIITDRLQRWHDQIEADLAVLDVSTSKGGRYPNTSDALPQQFSLASNLVQLWHAYLLPLAPDTSDIQHSVQRALLHVCWQQGWFDRKEPGQRTAARPAFVDLAHHTERIYTMLHQNEQHCVGMLLSEGFCEQKRTAGMVIGQLALSDQEAVHRAHAHLCQTFLLPLAHAMGIHTRAEREHIQHCWKRGWFDQQGTHWKVPIRPRFDDVLEKVRAVLQQQYRQDQVSGFVEAALCVDEATAWKVVDHLKFVDEEAIDATEQALRTVATYGTVGLLLHADYPFVDPLLRLEQLTVFVPQMTENSDMVLAEVRADIVALGQVLYSRDAAARQREEDKKHERNRLRRRYGWRRARRMIRNDPDTLEGGKHAALWRLDLFHQPRFSTERIDYRHHISTTCWDSIVQELASVRSRKREEAQQLFSVWIDAGLDGMVDWRAGVPADALHHSVTMHRLRASLDKHLGWLKPGYRQEIERLLISLWQAIDALPMSLALFPLVDEHPGTDSRRKFRKVLNTEPKLIAVFARHAGLTDDKDASARLHAFCSYGGLGLLRFRKQHETGEDETLLAQVIHPRLTNYLHFQKLAHPEERLALSRLMPPTIAYAHILGFPYLSPQVVNALANRLPKGKHWNVGKGATTAPVRQRSSLSIRKTPRIHEAWVILPLTLTVPIVDEGGNPISNTVHLLLVLDHDSALPMGCWASPHLPGAAEIGLTLYQAVWHVGSVDWPLRGVPRAVQIPTNLKLTDAALTDLNRAAFFLGTAIEREKLKETWRKQQLVSALTYSGQEIVTQFVKQPRATCQQVQDAVLR